MPPDVAAAAADAHMNSTMLRTAAAVGGVPFSFSGPATSWEGDFTVIG